LEPKAGHWGQEERLDIEQTYKVPTLQPKQPIAELPKNKTKQMQKTQSAINRNNKPTNPNWA
jgi:hypothetical protein